MATIERIEQDIQSLEQMVRGIAQSLQDSYTTYFAALGQAVRQQLILATYHLCTQGYPQTFLRMSLNQRQKLQQSIRDLGTQTADQLQKYTKLEIESLLNQDKSVHKNAEVDDTPTDEKHDEDDEDDKLEITAEGIPLSFIELLASQVSPFDMEELDEDELEEFDDEFEDEDSDSEEDEEDEEDEESEPQKRPDKKKAIPLPKIPIFPLLNPVPLPFAAINPTNPIEASKWVQSLEMSTQFALKKLSREANILLQKSEILPKKLPEPIIEAAAAASDVADVIPGPPNVLNVVVEVENERRPNDSGFTQIMAVNLRLTEIEFADSNVSSKRKQIRILQGQLQKLRREYLKKQRELAVAQAEAAWRSSWFDQ
jgi:hypothetical protein